MGRPKPLKVAVGEITMEFARQAQVASPTLLVSVTVVPVDGRTLPTQTYTTAIPQAP